MRDWCVLVGNRTRDCRRTFFANNHRTALLSINRNLSLYYYKTVFNSFFTSCSIWFLSVFFLHYRLCLLFIEYTVKNTEETERTCVVFFPPVCGQQGLWSRTWIIKISNLGKGGARLLSEKTFGFHIRKKFTTNQAYMHASGVCEGNHFCKIFILSYNLQFLKIGKTY